MEASAGITLRPLAASDAAPLAVLLAASRPGYTRFFQPFAFDAATVDALLFRARRDLFFAVEITRGATRELAGFSMLRGWDEGFAEPMYGVFIAEPFAGRGLARLTLAHAESVCRINGCPALLLKVDPANLRAFELYRRAGFTFLRADPRHGNHVLRKALAPA